MDVFIASDHGGFKLKQSIQQVDFLNIIGSNINFIDCGTDSTESCDYPIFAKKLIKNLKKYIPLNNRTRVE